MKLRSKLITAILASALLLATVLWTPAAVAYEPLCAICLYTPFYGPSCSITTSHSGRTDCFSNSAGVCYTYGPICFNLLTIEP